MNPASNLFLIGPMGAGKTTVGRRLADLFGLPFFDVDHEVEERTGAAVTLIFDVEGEAGFRQREAAAVAELATRSGIIMATGGGAVLDAGSRQLLRSRGFVLWLDAPPQTQLARLERDRRRPLLAAPDRRERLQQLAEQRNPLYREIADLVVASTGNDDCAQLAHHVAELLAERWQRERLPEPAAS